jgi:lipid-binding SYLF domain-containing protein
MNKRKKRPLLSLALAIFLIAPMAAKQGAAQSEDPAKPGIERIEKSIQVLQEIVDLPEKGLPSALLKKVYGMAIIPGVVKAAYGFGGQYGRGIIVVRTEDGGWSNPVFISLIGGSLGFQIGVQKADIVLVFRSRKGIDNIVSGKLTLGADASVAAGPVGRSAEVGTDLAMEAEIYSYSKSRGLFAGVSIKGASLKVDWDAINAFYGRGGLSVDEIFKNVDLPVPSVVLLLKDTLSKYTSIGD